MNAIDESGLPISPVEPHPIECERARPAAPPVSKTAEKVVERLKAHRWNVEGGYETNTSMVELIQAALDAHAIRAGELVREAAAEACGNAVVFAERIRALDIPSIVQAPSSVSVQGWPHAEFVAITLKNHIQMVFAQPDAKVSHQELINQIAEYVEALVPTLSPQADAGRVSCDG